MKCCGFHCKTRFCPHCGKSQGAANPLVELLEFLRDKQTSSAKVAEKWNKRREEAGVEKLRHEPRSRESSERFKGWADALEALIDGPKPEAA